MQYLRKHKRLFLAIIFSLLFIITLLGQDIYREISNSIRFYDEIYKQIIVNYTDQLRAKELTEAAVRSMLSELDPYTVLLKGDEKDPIETLSTGQYGGVGIRISMKKDSVTVIAPIDGTPAARAGLLPGDVIIQVDSIRTTGKNLDEIAKLIRGKVGTNVTLYIIRPGIHGESEYSLRRERIQIDDVNYAGIISDGIGYIRLSGFSRGASREVVEAYNQLKKESQLRSLILDLRGNPGGLLDEALKVAEVFIEQGDTLLYTRGRTEKSNKVFIAVNKPVVDPRIEVAVLVDGGSASASEIVAGVIQDLDRGIIIGNTTFGKGLVQSVFRIDKDVSVKITTAKYYIPSGRLIQKPDYLKNPKLSVSVATLDSVFASKNGRILQGNGGIIPDFQVDRPVQPQFIQELWRQNVFYNYALQYKTKNPDIAVEFTVNDEMLKDFKNYVQTSNFSYQLKPEKQLRELESQLYTDSLFKKLSGTLDPYYQIFEQMKEKQFDKHQTLIRQGISAEMATLLGGISGRIQETIQDDPVVLKAIEILNDHADYRAVLGYLE
jgi:carboxyl-terminal processing protease